MEDQEESLKERAGEALDEYAPEAERPPLLSYAVTMATFNIAFASALAGARRTGHELPAEVSAGEIILIGTASHKMSRLITKDKVTSPIRAPFTELEGKGGPSELREHSRGRGAKRAIGELLSCPYCLGLWVVGAFSLGRLFAPRFTRFIASALTSLTISDFLQIAYKAAEEKGLD